jgi:hypothetical protein
MTSGDSGSSGLAGSFNRPGGSTPNGSTQVIVAEISPFHCLYQDAVEFHTQSRQALPRSESASSRLARGSFLLYIGAAEALVHQAAIELSAFDRAALIADPTHPRPTFEAWKLLPAIVGVGSNAEIDESSPPWPQFAELLALRESWAYPGFARARRAYYRSTGAGSSFEPLQPHQASKTVGITREMLVYPRTGIPRDPYALRPIHLDTIRAVLDASIEALDQKLEGALTRGNRHRREPIQVVGPASP